MDLSVAGLLIGIRTLSMAGVPRREVRAACILLTLCGAAELALNIAGPIAAGAYGRAAFDAVSPLLLIGWAETGPRLLRCLYAPRQLTPGYETGPAEPAPGSMARSDNGDLVRTQTVSRPGTAGGHASQARTRRKTAAAGAGPEDLLARARQIDQGHRLRYSRPVSAETLRKQMRIGSMRAGRWSSRSGSHPAQPHKPLGTRLRAFSRITMTPSQAGQTITGGTSRPHIPPG